MLEFSRAIERSLRLLPGKVNGKLANTILDKIDAFVCIVDISRLKLIWTNRYITRRLGYSSKELTTLTSDEMLSLFQPCFQEYLVESIKQLNDTPNQDSQVVFNVKTKDNHWIWVLATITIYENNSDGSFHYLIVFATEIDINRLHEQISKLPDGASILQHAEISKLLSVREKNIVKLITNGNTDKEISESLNISIHTAKTHRKKIIRKLCLKNSRVLIKYAVENGMG